MERMRADMDGLLLLNQRMAEAILQLRAGQVHNQGNPIVIDDDSSEDEVAETPRIPEGALLVPIEDEEVVEESSEEDEEEEVWEIPREEFEDAVVDTRHSSPEL